MTSRGLYTQHLVCDNYTPDEFCSEWIRRPQHDIGWNETRHWKRFNRGDAMTFSLHARWSGDVRWKTERSGWSRHTSNESISGRLRHAEHRVTWPAPRAEVQVRSSALLATRDTIIGLLLQSQHRMLRSRLIFSFHTRSSSPVRTLHGRFPSS